MIPVRNIQACNQDDHTVTLVIPKFKNTWMQKWLIPEKRSKYIRIHLDITGSKVWNLIDGVRNTYEICNLLTTEMTEQAHSGNLTDIQITEFLRQLFRNRFITFK
jgi:hypothetical protein